MQNYLQYINQKIFIESFYCPLDRSKLGTQSATANIAAARKTLPF